MSSRKQLSSGEWGDLLMFLERVVPRGAAEAAVLGALIDQIHKILDNHPKRG